MSINQVAKTAVNVVAPQPGGKDEHPHKPVAKVSTPDAPVVAKDKVTISKDSATLKVAGETPAQEAAETPAETAKEANKGDGQAQRLLAKQVAAAEIQKPPVAKAQEGVAEPSINKLV